VVVLSAVAYAMVGSENINVLAEGIGPKLFANELDNVKCVLKARNCCDGVERQLLR
jgi:hypothetical protein